MKRKIVMRPIEEEPDIFNGLAICLTNKCNMDCTYCSRNSGIGRSECLSLQTVLATLDFFNSKRPNQRKYLQLTGGEIFTYPDIFSVIEYAIEKGFICRLQTNGLLLKRAVQKRPELLSSKQVVIKVSLDGWDEHTHGLYRGVETFQPIVAGVKAALSVNPNVALKTVIHEENFDRIGRMLDFCLKIGVKGWSYNTLMKLGRSSKVTAITELMIAEKLVPLYNRAKYCRLLNGSNVQVYKWMQTQRLNCWPPFFFVNYDGRIFVTDKTIDERLVGSVFGRNLEEEFVYNEKTVDLGTLTVSSEVLDYVANHLRVEIERR